MRALIVGNATVDLLTGGETRIGGSVYYGGRALAKHMGVETYGLTRASDRVRDLVSGALLEAGVKPVILGAEESPVFVVNRGKAVEFRGSSPPIPWDVVAEYLESTGFDAVIFAPIMREVEPEAILEAGRRAGPVYAADIQGFVRKVTAVEIKCEWSNVLEEVLPILHIVHGNISEYCFAKCERDVLKKIVDLSTVSNTIYLASADNRGTYLVHRREVYHIPPLPVNAVDDVGAGDVLLAVSTYYLATGKEALEATTRGVVAASLKTQNPAGEWFTPSIIEELWRKHVAEARRVEAWMKRV